jgi:hypothetical protein
MAPRCRMFTRSHTASTSGMNVSGQNHAVLIAQLADQRANLADLIGSSPTVGSSRMTTSGSWTMAMRDGPRAADSPSTESRSTLPPSTSTPQRRLARVTASFRVLCGTRWMRAANCRYCVDGQFFVQRRNFGQITDPGLRGSGRSSRINAADADACRCLGAGCRSASASSWSTGAVGPEQSEHFATIAARRQRRARRCCRHKFRDSSCADTVSSGARVFRRWRHDGFERAEKLLRRERP